MLGTVVVSGVLLWGSGLARAETDADGRLLRGRVALDTQLWRSSEAESSYPKSLGLVTTTTRQRGMVWSEGTRLYAGVVLDGVFELGVSGAYDKEQHSRRTTGDFGGSAYEQIHARVEVYPTITVSLPLEVPVSPYVLGRYGLVNTRTTSSSEGEVDITGERWREGVLGAGVRWQVGERVGLDLGLERRRGTLKEGWLDPKSHNAEFIDSIEKKEGTTVETSIRFGLYLLI